MTVAQSTGCAIPFTEHQRQMLKDLSDVRENKNYTQSNRKLDDYIETLQSMYPEMFMRTKQDFDERMFFDEPMSEPKANFVRARSKSPYLKGLK